MIFLLFVQYFAVEINRLPIVIIHKDPMPPLLTNINTKWRSAYINNHRGQKSQSNNYLLVHPDQTGFISGRHHGDNLQHLLLNIIDRKKQRNQYFIPGCS